MDLEFFEKVFSSNDTINQDTIREHIAKIKELSEYLPKSQSYFMIQDSVNQSVAHVCDNYKHILGYDKKELLTHGLPFQFSHYHPDDIGNWLKILDELMTFTMTNVPREDRAKCVYTWSFRVKTKSGNYLNIQECLTPIYFDDAGKPLVGFSQSTVLGNEKKQPQIGICKILNSNSEYETLFYKNYSKDDLLNKLSNREIDIVRLLSKGLTSKEISERLNISTNTTSTHRKNILSKLDFHSSAQIINYCLENQIF